ncbi:polysaccharide biosynthesis C-terminal domain-containing protein [Bacteroidota bacterium]
MRKSFIVNLVFLLTLNFLIKPFWIFGIDRTVQNITGSVSYGFYFSLFSFSLVFYNLLDLGITNYNNREIAQHNQLLKKYFSNIFGMKVLLGIMYFVFCMILGLFIGYSLKQLSFLFVILFNQFLSSFILYLRSNVSALYYFKTDSILSVLDRLLMILICGFLLWSKFIKTEFKIEWFVYAQTASYVLTFLTALLIVLAQTGRLRFRIDIRYAIIILKKSFPYALLILLMSSYTYFDSVMIERLLPEGKYQTGIYAQSFRIFNALAMFALLFANLLLPMFSRMIKNKEPVDQLVHLSFTMLFIVSFLSAVSSIFYREEIMNLLYDDVTNESLSVFSILILGFIAVSTTYIFGTLLTANGNLKHLNRMAVLGVFLNVGLNLLLIPKFYALGAAIASLFTQFVTAGIQVILSVKIFQFKTNWKYIIKLLVFSFLIILCLKFTRNVQYHWILKFFTINFTGLVLAVVFDILPFKEGVRKIKTVWS